MRKLVLSVVLVLCLVFSSAIVVMADPGFRIGAGYEEINNTCSINTDFCFGNLAVDIHTPSKMYSVDLGYDFNDYFAINGKYAWGSSDLAKLDASWGPFPEEIPELSQDNRFWQVEAVFQAPVGSNFKIGGIVGYANSETTTKGTYDVVIPFLINAAGTGQVKQSFDGGYIGALVAINPTETFELGASYRYFINPTGNVKITTGATETYTMNDLYVSTLDVYGKFAINKNWSAKAGYSYSWCDYSFNVGVPVDVKNKTGSLYAKMEYKF